MAGRRWLVHHLPGGSAGYRWVAIEPGCRGLVGPHGPTCDCYPFGTFAAAIEYATRQARTTN